MPLSPSLERAVSIAAAGSHHLLLLGSKGAGKSHALDWLSELHPPVSPKLRIRNAILAEMAGMPVRPFLDDAPPVRRVSSNVRPAALLGKSTSLMMIPGEFTLAHGGVLIADELPEWARDSRESLREPLENGSVSLTRASGTYEIPAAFTLAATGNFCPCGGWPSNLPAPLDAGEKKPPRCRCTLAKREHYLAKLSGPILDRLDLTVLVVGSLKRAKSGNETAESRLRILRAQVVQVRERLIRSWGGPPGTLPAARIAEFLNRNPRWERYLELSSITSLRARHKIIRVALTLSGWDGLEAPNAAHFLEAASYRPERFGFCD